jgi:hypothetical protein
MDESQKIKIKLLLFGLRSRVRGASNRMHKGRKLEKFVPRSQSMQQLQCAEGNEEGAGNSDQSVAAAQKFWCRLVQNLRVSSLEKRCTVVVLKFLLLHNGPLRIQKLEMREAGWGKGILKPPRSVLENRDATDGTGSLLFLREKSW